MISLKNLSRADVQGKSGMGYEQTDPHKSLEILIADFGSPVLMGMSYRDGESCYTYWMSANDAQETIANFQQMTDKSLFQDWHDNLITAA